MPITAALKQTPPLLITAGGRIRCTQCTAQSKRTKVQCRAPATKGKKVCKFHGGSSTGPKTPADAWASHNTLIGSTDT
jgi:hypothetical protein